MPRLNLLVKPVSGECNLRCDYCFYSDEQKNRKKASYGSMSGETIENVTRKALTFAHESCTFGFQGGEPMLAGLPFYKIVIQLQQEYNVKSIAIQNLIQTNGVLMNDEWASFFRENNFLVGLSLDGDAFLHDRYRRDVNGLPTHEKVTAAAKLLEKHGVSFNILSVVSAQSAKRIGEIYPYFIRNGFLHQQYIRCLDSVSSSGQESYFLTPALYSRFLRKLFDLWLNDCSTGKSVYIRYFDNIAAMMNGIQPESCDMRGVCGIQYAIEADGSVFPCDFYMLDEFFLGNLNTNSFPEIDKKRKEIEFQQLSAVLPDDCKTCKWLSLCRNGCRRERDTLTGKNKFCSAYLEFFPYAVEKLHRSSMK